MQHYLTKPKYSAGKINKLKHIGSDEKFINVKASMALDDTLVTILKGDALKMFLHRKDEYHGKGFKKLAVLKDEFAGESQIQIAKEMFAFFQGFPQGDSSPDSHEAGLHKLFEKIDISGNPLSMSFQVMLMV